MYARQHWQNLTDVFRCVVAPRASEDCATTIKKLHEPVSSTQPLVLLKYLSKESCFRALKESGYESDSTLVFRRREDAALQLSPSEQKEAYKTIQKGGDVPLQGLRKTVPERPKGN